jgi:drug/metabolite transporter (DMT)-like permease
MLLPASGLGIVFALVSAFLGGSGDFIGGLATRRSSPFQVLTLTSIAGLVTLLLCAAGWREPLPPLSSAGWAMSAGVVAVVGMSALYRTLSLGYAASVAPTSGVIGAGLPVVFTALTVGWPGPARLAGFALALLGIGLVSQSVAPGGGRVSRQGFGLACLAGSSFGVFFILLGQMKAGPVFMLLVLTRCASLATLLLVLWASRQSLPALTSNPAALFIGVIDAVGTALYVLAKQFTRLDVAAVLVSLYPAVTVLLACIVVKEKVSRNQWIGAALCLAAIGLITV